MRRREAGRTSIVSFALLALAGFRPASGRAAAAEGAATVPPGDPRAVVVALAVQRPGLLSGLETIVGPLHRDRARWEEATGPLDRPRPSPAVRRVHVELGIDPFHFDPRKVEDPRLSSYALELAAGSARSVEGAALAALRAAFGPASELMD